jgi:hypothetical protein
LAVAAENSRVSGDGRIMRRNGKKGIMLCKQDFIVFCSYSETVARIRLAKTEKT